MRLASSAKAVDLAQGACPRDRMKFGPVVSDQRAATVPYCTLSSSEIHLDLAFDGHLEPRCPWPNEVQILGRLQLGNASRGFVESRVPTRGKPLESELTFDDRDGPYVVTLRFPCLRIVARHNHQALFRAAGVSDRT